MGDIKLLDCTLRDGAYIVDSMFGNAAIKGVIEKLQEANVDIIECGWLKDKEHVEGSSFFHTPSDLIPYLKKDKNSIYVAMIDWNRYDVNILPQNDGKSIDAIRVVFPREYFNEGIEIGRKILEKGYDVFFQAANTLAYSDEELKELAEKINEVVPMGLSVVDTFGAMYEEDIERIVGILDGILDEKIMLGFHSHNNQQLSFSNTIYFTKLLASKKRSVIVDSSLCGMGRGAGNATTELVANYLNKKFKCNFDMNKILDAIDIYMEPFLQKYSWGYSTPYFIAGMYCTHVNNIAYLTNNHRSSARDIHNVLESMEPEDRIKYDYDLLEEKYMDVQSKKIDDEKTFDDLKNFLTNRKVLLVAPGKSSLQKQKEIIEYAKENDCVTIGVNAIIKGFDYDYLFFVNHARYEYAQKAENEVFDSTRRIILSNIKDKSENESVLNYSRVIKKGFKYFDNAMIVALRLCDMLEIENVSIAGFDGFKHQYNESYADVLLPTLNSEGKWDELNDEIKAMYKDFYEKKRHIKSITFVTESIFVTED